MKRVVPDASALAALMFGEPESDRVAPLLRDAELFAPTLLQFELASIARKKIKKHPDSAVQVLSALRGAIDDGGIAWVDVNLTDVVLVAEATGLTPYDASYLCVAGMFGADLVTLDRRLAAAGATEPV